MNEIIQGDCIDIMNDMPSDSIDMIYADPPFYSGKEYKDDRKGVTFNDKWSNIDAYLQFMKERLIRCRHLLKPTGTLYLHCDWHASHYLKIILDNAFGYDNFRNEIIWQYHRWTAASKSFQNMHDTIFRYTKTKDFIFNIQYRPAGDWIKKDYKHVDADGRRWRHSGGTTSKGRKVYYDPTTYKGVSLDDVWDINRVGSTAKERVGYPTQKLELLLARIINASTNKGDLILDPFCGGGTTCRAAKTLGRNYIGIDVSKDACDISRTRLLQESLI